MTYRDVFYPAPDGLMLYARDYGDPGQGQDQGQPGRPPILCLPGLTRNSRDFAGLAEHLAPAHRVVVAEQRGRGRSAYDPDPARYQPMTYVGDMAALLDHLGIGRAIVIGTSLGGIMAMIMTATMPERIAAAVINDVGPVIDPGGLERIKSYVGKLAPPRDWAEAETQTRMINAGIFPDFSDSEWRTFTRGLYREDDQGVPVADYDPLIAVGVAQGTAAPPDLWPLFETLKAVPTLAIRGEHSDLLSGKTFAEMQRRHPAMIAVTIPNRGHAPTLTEPASIAVIDAFLDGLEREQQ